jgi:hypothetical protein
MQQNGICGGFVNSLSLALFSLKGWFMQATLLGYDNQNQKYRLCIVAGIAAMLSINSHPLRHLIQEVRFRG